MNPTLVIEAPEPAVLLVTEATVVPPATGADFFTGDFDSSDFKTE
ncbi:MAG: hypothetical protein NTV51_12220 [Verrucomicrobia bacterium]|nr:hypothetical protein [Verrucomicrobiota bacterium]